MIPIPMVTAPAGLTSLAAAMLTVWMIPAAYLAPMVPS